MMGEGGEREGGDRESIRVTQASMDPHHSQ